ncbi:MAG TPA: phosphatase PAP2 family protein [Flavisolibacter sp.]|nr:phosphatase PAP2 family protein [Flavisolibacter sp.]
MALFNVLYFLTRTTRNFITGFSIFMIYWIIFDYMKAFPNYRYNTVHIESLYQLEKQLFGFMSGGVRVTPNEYFALHHSTFVDVLSGLFYLCWIPVPLAFAGVLFFRNRRYFYHFALTFFLVNLIGFVGYYSYPAAPPWYIPLHGFDFIAHTPGNTAGLSRFDAFFGTHIFEGLYSKSSNVFAAMPSLHAAYMLIVLYFGIVTRMGKWNVLFAVILMGIWFTAVYSSHHYVLDVLAGISCGLLGIFLFRRFSKTGLGTRFLDGCVKASS